MKPLNKKEVPKAGFQNFFNVRGERSQKKEGSKKGPLNVRRPPPFIEMLVA